MMQKNIIEIFVFLLFICFFSCQSRDDRIKKYIVHELEKEATLKKFPIKMEEFKIVKVTPQTQHEIDLYRVGIIRKILEFNENRKSQLLKNKEWYEREIQSLKGDIEDGNVAWDATHVDDIADYTVELTLLDSILIQVEENILFREEQMSGIMSLSNSVERSKNEFYMVDYWFKGDFDFQKVADTVKFIVPK